MPRVLARVASLLLSFWSAIRRREFVQFRIASRRLAMKGALLAECLVRCSYVLS